VKFRSTAGLDLMAPPLSHDAERWTHPVDYGSCQDLAEHARDAGIEVIRYASARIPNGVNLALLTCRAFTSRRPAARQTWRVYFGASGVRVLCDDPEARLEFDRRAFAADPRIASLEWTR
jgi:hypothetical protein